MPVRVPEGKFDLMKQNFKKSKNCELREDVSNKIVKMLEGVSPVLRKNKLNGQETIQQKQIYLTNLVVRAKIDVHNLELIKGGQVKMNYYKMLDNLNQLLLGQYLLKSGLNLTKNDLTEIQSADSKLSKTITEMKRQNITILGDLKLHGGIFYKIKKCTAKKALECVCQDFLDGKYIINYTIKMKLT